MKIKVCGLKYQENIEDLSELNINYFGFIFYKKSQRYIADDLDFDFVRRIPKQIKKVGVFVNESVYSILNKVAQYDLDFVQLHGLESEEFCAELKPYVKVIKAFGVYDKFQFADLEKYLQHVDYFLFDTYTKLYGGSGEVFNWQTLNNYTLNKPFFLSGGIDLTSSKQISQFKHPQFYGVDINSKFEIKSGLKDKEKIKLFIQNFNKNENK